MKFYICKRCGNIVAVVKQGKCTPSCCGESMSEIIPGTVEASAEKHIPVVSVDGNIATVKVGEVAHPMLPEHYIEWIAIETTYGNQRKKLSAGDEPEVKFALLDGEEIKSAYAYCNLHSLWKS